MDKTSLTHRLAKCNKLSVINTNGCEILVGFDSWEDAERFCIENLDIDDFAEIINYKDGYAVKCANAREDEILTFTDNEIIREAERRGGVVYDAILDNFIEAINYGNKPNLILDDFISWFSDSPIFSDFSQEEAIEAGTFYWKHFLGNHNYNLCNTGDPEEYVDFIKSHKIIEHNRYRILAEGSNLYHLYRDEIKIGDFDGGINTILESLVED